MSGVGQREVLVNVGEGWTDTDANNMQRFLRAVWSDWDFAARGGAGQSRVGVGAFRGAIGANPVFAMGDAGAPYPDSGTNLKVKVKGGPVVVYPGGSTESGVLTTHGTDWGMDSHALVYYLQDSELDTVHAVGDGVNPRWDLVTLKLQTVDNDAADQESRLVKNSSNVVSTGVFVKRRKVTITKTLYAGTPGATPAIPAVPAGECALYAIRVPTGYNAPFGFAELRDHRIPLGRFSVDVNSLAEYVRGSAFSVGADTQHQGPIGAIQSAGAGLAVVHVPRLIDPASCRLIAVSALVGAGNNAAVFELKRYAGGGASGYGFDESDVSAYTTPTYNTALRGNPAVKSTEWRSAGVDSTVTVTGCPVWGTGYACGYAADPSSYGAPSGPDLFTLLGLKWTAGGANAYMSMVRFHFAGGA